MLFFESAQTHTGVDDADFTCWLLQAFVEALIRRRDGEKKIEFGQPPSRERCATGTTAAAQRRRRRQPRLGRPRAAPRCSRCHAPG